MTEIGFGELVGRMVWGTGAPDSCRGVVRTIDDEGERRERVIRVGFLVREETEDGQPRRIIGREASWFWDDDDNVMRVRPHEDSVGRMYGGAPIGGLGVGDHRPSWQRWEGTDFTRPSSAVEQIEFLGRLCYTVELAPPGHKPFPLRITVDAATGLVLRTANAGFGTVTEWAEVEIGVDIPEKTFTWTGLSETMRTHAESMQDHNAEQAQRRAWLETRGIGAITVPTVVELTLHDWDDVTGAFYSSIDANSYGTLLRRPVSDEQWDEPGTTNYAHNHRWADPRWDWFLATDVPLSADQLDQLKEQLRTSI